MAVTPSTSVVADRPLLSRSSPEEVANFILQKAATRSEAFLMLQNAVEKGIFFPWDDLTPIANRIEGHFDRKDRQEDNRRRSRLSPDRFTAFGPYADHAPIILRRVATIDEGREYLGGQRITMNEFLEEMRCIVVSDNENVRRHGGIVLRLEEENTKLKQALASLQKQLDDLRSEFDSANF